jgi:ABC-2 type transport system permease protein
VAPCSLGSFATHAAPSDQRRSLPALCFGNRGVPGLRALTDDSFTDDSFTDDLFTDDSFTDGYGVKPIRELWDYRFLIWNLAQRDLRSRYKKSVLGWLWSLINPASTLVIFSVVFGLFLGGNPPEAANHDKNFGLWLFAGLVVWNFFSGTVNGSITALSTSGGLLKKVYFPATAPAVANLLVGLSQALIEFTILGLFIIAFRNASAYMLLFPLVVVITGVFALGIGLWVSIFNLYYRDIGYLVGIALNILFYGTPIVYPLTLGTLEQYHLLGLSVGTILRLNPLTDLVEMNRDFFYANQLPSWQSSLYVIGAAIISLLVGWFVFSRRAEFVSEEI